MSSYKPNSGMSCISKGLSVVNHMVCIDVGLIVILTTFVIIVCGIVPRPSPARRDPSTPNPLKTQSSSYHGHVHTILFTFCIKFPPKNIYIILMKSIRQCGCIKSVVH